MIAITYSITVDAEPLQLLNMKVIVALCLVAVVAAAPPPADTKFKDGSKQKVELLRYDSAPLEDNKYSFTYEQDDGQRREEQGELKNAGLPNPSLSVKGSYHWVGPDGVEYRVTYNADENGYQPEVQQGPGGAVSPQLASLLG